MGKFFIVSYNKNIALSKEIQTLNNSLIQIGYSSKIELGKRNILNIFKYKSDDHIILYNTSILNFVLYFFRFLIRYKVATVFHEPYKTKAELTCYSISDKIKYMIIKRLHFFFFNFTNFIVVLSEDGYSRIPPKYSRKVIKSRILLPPTSKKDNLNKNFIISWLGACNQNKGFNDFVEFVLENNISAIICTRDVEIAEEKFRNYKNKKIIHFQNDSDGYDALSDSHFAAVFHPVLTQSGVVAQALSCGCGIVSKLDKINKEYSSSESIVRPENFSDLSNYDQVREEANFNFLENHHMKNFKKYYSSLLR